MVLSYLASYVYAPANGNGGASLSSSSSSSQHARSSSGGPIPTRANSVRRTGNSGSSSRYGNTRSSSSRNGSRFRTSTIPEDCENGDSSRPAPDDPALAIIHHINTANSFYDVVGVPQNFKTNEELRRAYMARCRLCHPDKFPNYTDEATAAFQRVSLAYETLSKPVSRKAYDLSGAKNGFGGPDGDPLGPDFGEETLRSVLYTMYCEFLEKGDFEMVRMLVEALNASNPGLNLGEEAIEGIEGALKRLRSVILSGAKHFRIVKFELIRLYEIQHDLRQLSYFDVFGRLRLSLQLARVTLSIPMAIDKAMREDDDECSDGVQSAGYVEDDEDALHASDRQVIKKGLLGPRVAGVLGLAVAILEKGERII